MDLFCCGTDFWSHDQEFNNCSTTKNVISATEKYNIPRQKK